VTTLNSHWFCVDSKDALDYLSDLVRIDSQINNIEGIHRAQLFIASKLERLGFKINYIENRQLETAPLLFAKRVGSSNSKTITFIAHSDVVTSANKYGFKINGLYAHGAGVADDKGGVTVALLGLEQFLSVCPHHDFNINVVISPNEETGSIGFHDFFKKAGEESDIVLGFEPALECGSVISSRSGNRWYQMKVVGKSAHSGRFGSEYINAAHKLSLLVSKMHDLNDEARRRRVNVGSFSGGGEGFNTICGEAMAKLDVRFSSFSCREDLHNQIHSILDQTVIECPYSGKKSQSFYSIEDDCPPLSNDLELDGKPWFQYYLEIVKELEGTEVRGKHAGGAADINYFATPEIKLLDGLGPIGSGLHTRQEKVHIPSLCSRAEALSTFLSYLEESQRVNPELRSSLYDQKTSILRM
jgi:glutamate carboxypeptidase